MSRRGNYHDYAVAEILLQLLKRAWNERKTYSSRADARSDVFAYIAMFYNSQRRHGANQQLFSAE